MAICRTCDAEYQPRDTLCPQCRHPLEHSSRLCHNCGAEITDQRLCPRCHGNVVPWEREPISTYRFILKGGYLGILPSFFAVVLGIYFQYNYSFYYQFSTLLSILISLLTFRILFMQRLFWREQFWASQIYHVRAPSPLTLTVVTFLLALSMQVLWVILYRELWTQPQYLSQLLIMTTLYGLSPILFTVSLTLFAIQQYLTELDERVPQPLFVHTDRLLEVVIRTLESTLGESVTPQENSAAPSLPRFEPLRIQRNAENGGIETLLREYRPLPFPGNDSVWEERAWTVHADRWGRIQSVTPDRPLEPCPESPGL